MILTFFLAIVKWVFSLITVVGDTTFTISTAPISETIEWAAQYVAYANGELPIFADPTMTGPVATYGLFDIFIVVYYFVLTFWTIRLTLKIIQIIPWIKLDQFNFQTFSELRNRLRRR